MTHLNLAFFTCSRPFRIQNSVRVSANVLGVPECRFFSWNSSMTKRVKVESGCRRMGNFVMSSASMCSRRPRLLIIAPGAKRRGKFPLVGPFYSPSDLKTFSSGGPSNLLSRSKAQRQCDYFLYTPVFKSQKKVKSWPRSESFQSSLIFLICMLVTQNVLEHLSREPPYYLPPDSNIYFHYPAATKVATKEAFEKPLEASRMF